MPVLRMTVTGRDARAPSEEMPVLRELTPPAPSRTLPSMPEILFTLGRTRDLALAEILHLLSWDGDAAFIGWTGDAALFACPNPPDLESLTRTAGGVIKAHEVIGRCPIDPDEIAQRVSNQHFMPEASGAESGKLTFGVSLEGFQNPVPERVSFFRAAAQRIKNLLKERGIASRFIGFQPGENSLSLSSVQVGENGLLTEGFEIVVARMGAECVVAHTVAVQDYVAYGHRDFERPERRVRSGMLPPKLARMMVNLARQKDTTTLLDPFCGSGGILMEALDLGLKAVGADLDTGAVAASSENLKWYAENRAEPVPEWHVRKCDARHLLELFEPLTAEAVAFEPYLGPPISKPLREEQARSIGKELKALYVEALAEIRATCKPGARVVMALPRIATRDEELKIPILREIELMGYKRPRVLPDGMKGSLLYKRPGQFVAREILVLEA